MGRLREQMVDCMRIRGYSTSTIELYTSCVALYARHFGASPLEIGPGRIPAFLLHLRDAARSDSTVRTYFEALKFFYALHGRRREVPELALARRRRRLPRVLARADVVGLLESCASLKLKALLSLIYSSGLRISEAAGLELSDVDFARNTVFVRNGKHGRDRYTILSRRAAELLRAYIAVHRPASFLFPRRGDISRPVSVDWIRAGFHRLASSRNLGGRVTVHTLRHCFATHLLEDGAGVFHVMRLLGHSSILTTMNYLHVQNLDLSRVDSPLDRAPPAPVDDSGFLLRSA
ncbi:MAG: site-specific integrase [Spirochaetales bacterium]|nr:site-specific integrase [Spirochaetales bacterium]